MECVGQESEEILERMKKNSTLNKYTDPQYKIPRIHKGSGVIKLIVIGQCPTVDDVRNRGDVKVVLNLDRNGNLKDFVNKISESFNINIDENLYATNMLKNFFTSPPSQIKEVDLFELTREYWIPLLQKELQQFDDSIPVVTLSEDVLRVVSTNDVNKQMKYYWGHTNLWRKGNFNDFKYLEPNQNIFRKTVIPFPHQPTIDPSSRKGIDFYIKTLPKYLQFIKLHFNK